MTDTIQLIQKLLKYLEEEEQRHYEEYYDVEDASKIEAIDPKTVGMARRI